MTIVTLLILTGSLIGGLIMVAEAQRRRRGRRFCRRCRHANSGDAKFCGRCGGEMS